ncbi:carboxypeptidase-like regulatory domain-containing protein [Hymenobacter koreensis]|uniref:Carboxypeptidase-like regulatory domain-containing protein n=1 Tax=Hymenobacter koreensis TaxID=1084523 RepID=A0ABP8IXV5_9BACT
MLRATVALTVPQPCHENWDHMTPATGGRHCASCQKVVIDFTLKTDAEILAFLKQRPSSNCGRFGADQLQRPLLPATSPTTPWRTWLAAVATLWSLRELSANESAAQVAPVEQSRAQARPADVDIPTQGNPAGLIIRGIVLDSATREVIPGATVLIEHTTVGVSSSADGSFALEVPTDVLKGGKSPAIIISSVGYLSSRLDAASLQGQPILMQADVKGFGEVVMVGGFHYSWYSPRGMWWKVRGLFTR